MEQENIKFSNGAQEHDVIINHEGGKVTNVVFKPSLHGCTPLQLAKLVVAISAAFDKIDPSLNRELAHQVEAEVKKQNASATEASDQDPEKKSPPDSGNVS